jgi:hypothetical protein
MNRARIILDDGQEYNVIVREFTVECGPCSVASITLNGALTEHEPRNLGPAITKVVFNNPATVVFWSDGTKTVVRCSDNDTFNPEIGLAMAICKKAFGNTGAYNEEFKKWVPRIGERGRTTSVDEMRRQLVEHCHKTHCSDCRLHGEACRCGRGAYFTGHKVGERGYMTDDEIRAAYNRVFGK